MLIRLAFRLLKLLATFAVLVVLGWLFREPLLNSLAGAWVVDDPATHADAIVVLGGGRDWRPFAAAELYKSGVSKRILVANVEGLRSEQTLSQPSETEVNLSILSKAGVPREEVDLFGNSVTSTMEEATGLRDWVATHKISSILIPTDGFHTRRAKWIFERQLAGTGVVVHVKAVPHPRYTTQSWWKKEEGLITFQNEILKSLYYLAKY